MLRFKACNAKIKRFYNTLVLFNPFKTRVSYMILWILKTPLEINVVFICEKMCFSTENQTVCGFWCALSYDVFCLELKSCSKFLWLFWCVWFSLISEFLKNCQFHACSSTCVTQVVQLKLVNRVEHDKNFYLAKKSFRFYAVCIQ